MKPYWKYQTGVGLIEIVISFFILGFGLLSLAMFTNQMFTDSGESKARAEALQLARQQLEVYRNDAALAGVTSLTDLSAESITGVNAVFSRSGTVTQITTPPGATTAVTVSWTDAENQSQYVALTSVINASDVNALAALVADKLPGGGFVASNTGAATYGADGETFTPGADTQDLTDLFDVSGVHVYLDVPDYILTDADGNVLIRSKSYLARVTGRVYLDESDIDLDDIWVRPSDVGVCPKELLADANDDLIRNEDGTTNVAVREVRYLNGSLQEFLEGETTDGTLVYRSFTYNCFFGTGWYGNVGILRTDTTNSNDRVCGGDPYVSDDGTAESRHPQLIGARTYRGYVPQYSLEDVDGNGKLDDPAVDGSGNRIYLSDGIAEGSVYGDTSGDSVDAPFTHDFLITRITGGVVDSSCLLPLAISYNREFDNNDGKFVCLFDEYGNKTCPVELPEDLGYQVTTTARTITGVIEPQNYDGYDPTLLTLVTSQSEKCTIDGTDWSCVIYDAGAGWEGEVLLASNGEETPVICSTDTLVFSDELGNTVTSDVEMSSSPFEVAETADACLSDGVAQTFEVTVTISNYSGNTASLSGDAAINPADEGVCTSLPSSVSAKSGSTPGSASFTCTLKDSFQGSISLANLPTYTRTNGAVNTMQVTQTASSGTSWVIKIR